MNNNNKRISFARIKSILEPPDLLAIQTESFEDFVQLQTYPAKRENKGLQQVFTGNFPIFDNKENYRLDFLEYYVEKPRYSIVECLERGLTFATPLKAKLRLSTKDPETEEFVNTVEQEVYLGNLPFMTEQQPLSSTVQRERLYLNYIVHPVLHFHKLFIQTERQFIQPELFL